MSVLRLRACMHVLRTYTAEDRRARRPAKKPSSRQLQRVSSCVNHNMNKPCRPLHPCNMRMQACAMHVMFMHYMHPHASLGRQPHHCAHVLQCSSLLAHSAPPAEPLARLRGCQLQLLLPPPAPAARLLPNRAARMHGTSFAAASAAKITPSSRSGWRACPAQCCAAVRRAA